MTRVEAEVCAGAVALLVVALMLGSWIGAREAAIKMKATVDAQQTVIAAAEKHEKDLQAAEADRDRATAASVAVLAAAASKQVTPAEIAAWIPKQLTPTGSVPFTIQIPPSTAANPTPDAIASIPQASLPALRDTIEKCQECSVKLSTATLDLAARDQLLSLSAEKLTAMTAERDVAIKAAKGGGFWTRFKRTAKAVGITAVVTAVAICGTGHCK